MLRSAGRDRDAGVRAESLGFINSADLENVELVFENQFAPVDWQLFATELVTVVLLAIL